MDVESEIRAVAREWARAVVANDADRIAAFTAEDWLMVSPAGVSPGAHFLTLVASGELTHSAMDLVGDAQVRVYGDVAVFVGRITNTAHYRGQDFPADEWTTDVFVRRADRWMCVLTHITEAAPD